MKIKKHYRLIKDFCADYHLVQSAEYALINDNFYIIQQKYKELSALKKHTSLLNLINKYAARYNYVYDIMSLHSYMRDKNISLSVGEVFALQSALCYTLIYKIGEECGKFTKLEKGSARIIQNCIQSLRKTNELDTDEAFKLFNSCESIFENQVTGFSESDTQTKNLYRLAIKKCAAKQKEDELSLLLNMAKNDGGVNLLREYTKPSKIYIALYFIFTIGFTIGFSWIFAIISGWIVAFAIFPIYDASVSFADFLFSHLLHPMPPPRLDLSRLPQNKKTLVVITSLLNGGISDEKLFINLEEFYLKNKNDNFFFGILADFCDSDEDYNARDSAISDNAATKINALNATYGNHFCLFLRARSLNKADNIYQGRERKRGAVCDLVKLIKKDVSAFKTLICGDYVNDITHILTLDSDTILPLDGVSELLCVALHPQNLPIVKNEKVIGGYAIFQPSMKTALQDSTRTYFSLLHANGGSMYESAAYDRYQLLSGSGVFCGKGLFDVDLFYHLVLPVLPDERILSHDILEGNILRCMPVTNMTFWDSTPKNSVSFFARAHRWIRGDIQNAFMIFGKKSDFWSKFKLCENLRRVITPISAALGFAFLTLMSNVNTVVVIAFASHIILPPILGIISCFARKSYTPRRFFSLCINSFLQNFYAAFYGLASIYEEAFVTADASLRALWRMFFSKKHLLQWITFSQTDGVLKDSPGYFIRAHIASGFLGTMTVAFAETSIMKCFGILWFLFPLTTFLMSKKIVVSDTLATENQKATLALYARDMFEFFEKNVGKKTHFLPPDNVQLSPSESVAMRTSPTNIGLYLLSLLAARDFGLITSKELASRAEQCLKSIALLEKYHGQLFNWYELKNLKVIGGKYVSAVDCGNFIVMLVVFANGLEDYFHEDERFLSLSLECKKMISEADFSFFYNEKKHLFNLGYDADKNESGNICYDMLMSEIRTACYFCAATGRVPKKLWQSLSRTLVAENGFVGMVSWSGTAFEYFMPELFLPKQSNSIIDESLQFAFYNQRKTRKNGVFGISESGFYSFDSEMNYQYKAHGVQEIALKKYPKTEFVVSPYSSFLMLGENVSACLKNLLKLKDMGAYGKYGFYEAIDMTDGESIVQSYMSHHIGMSILGAANICFDKIFQKRFMQEKQLFACRELLCECIPKRMHLFVDIGNAPQKSNPGKPIPPTKIVGEPSLADPSAAFIHGGSLTLEVSGSGHIFMKYGEYAINDISFLPYSQAVSASFSFFDGDNPISFTPIEGNGKFSFEKSKNRFAFISSSVSLPCSVSGTIFKAENSFVFKVKLPAEQKMGVGFSFVPVLDKLCDYKAHQAFSSLFTVSSYDKDSKSLFFFRNTSDDTKKTPCIAIALSDLSIDFEYTSNCEHLNSHSHSLPSDYFPLPRIPAVGECISPLCAFKTEPISDVCFIVSCGSDKNECLSFIAAARKKQFTKTFLPPYPILTEKLFTSSIFRKNHGQTLLSAGALWKFSISGDYPLFVLNVYEESSATSGFIDAFVQLSNAFIRCEILFIVNECDKYLSPLTEFIKSYLRTRNCMQYLGKKGGIFILSSSEISENEFEFIKIYADFYAESDSMFDETQKNPYAPLPLINTAPSVVNLVSQSEYEYVVSKEKPCNMPYSYVISGASVGCVVTQSTLGFAFYENARENRISPFDTNPFSACYGLRILVFCDGNIFDVAATSGSVKYFKGSAEYHGKIFSHYYVLKVFASPKLPLIFYELTFADDFSATAAMLLPLETKSEFSQIENGYTFRKLSESPCEYTGFICKSEKAECISDYSLLINKKNENRGDICSVSGTQSRHVFMLGAVKCKKNIQKIIKTADFNKEYAASLAFYENNMPKIALKVQNDKINSLFNCFAPYQAAFSRFYAKSGFYQTGGAFGFRDQLQDCLCLIYSNTQLVRTHILRCAAHQYCEGDVMHWWFKTKNGDAGIRTKCSDDYLFLPYTVADYVKKTGDIDILDKCVGYLDSPPVLGAERFEIPQKSSVFESIYLHCIRALANGEKFGAHGISLMGSCDWNDGFSNIGVLGKGESVFTSWLFLLVFRDFLPVMKQKNDIKSIEHFTKIASILLINIEKNCFSNDRYVRAFFDDGRVLGDKSSVECKIDILSQAFAAIVCGENSKTKKAMNTAFNLLFDEITGIFKLFSPPFKTVDAGYISSYCEGIRENGGQYTHGALWGVWGLLCVGETQKALTVLNSIMPYAHNKSDIYKIEPYVVAADIYSGAHAGRGGWSWYTGSAAWYYKIMLEQILGIDLYNGFKIINVKPKIDYNLIIALNDYILTVCVSPLIQKITLDGNEVLFPLEIPGGEHKLEIPLNQ